MYDNRNAVSAKKRKPAWSSEEETLLIELYRKFSLLWDRGHPEYYKKDQRESALRAIANQMGHKFTAANVKDKMKTLRDYFVREKKKAETRGKHTSTGYVSQWEHFGSLEFLSHSTAYSVPEDMPDLGANVSNLAIKSEPPEVYPVFPDGEGPDNAILPSSPGNSSDDKMQLDSQARHGTKRAADRLPPEERPNPDLLKPGPSGISAAHARSSVAGSPTMIVQRTRPAAASPAESPEGNGQPLVTPGRGHQPGPNTGAIPPCPVHLENEEEVLFYHQLMSELSKMNNYDQDVAKLRMLEALFEIKHNSGPPPPSPGGQEL